MAFFGGRKRPASKPAHLTARELALDKIRDALILLNHQDKIIEMNHPAQELAGLPASQTTGLPLAELFPEVAKKLRLPRRNNWQIEVTLENKGSQRLYELHNSILYDENQNQTGQVIILHDITRQKQAEVALQKSEKRFRALIEKSTDAILLLDGDGNTTYVSPAAGKILGYELEAFMVTRIFALIHPADQEFADRLLTQLQSKQGETVTGEIRMRHQDGSWRWIEGTATNLLADPAVQSIVVNYRDITDRKQAQRTLQAQKDLLQSLVVVARATSEAAELEEMLHNLVSIGKWLTLAESGSVFLFDQIGALVFSSSYHGRLEPERVIRLMRQGLSGWVVKNNKPALVTDTLTDERWLELSKHDYAPRSALAVPIYSGHLLLAILVLTHSRPGHFDTSHLKTLEAASGQMAMAMRNARLYSDARSNLADLNALIESSRDGIILVNLDGHTRVINVAAMNLVGLAGEPADWVGKLMVDLYWQARRSAPELIKTMIGESRRVQNGDVATGEGEFKTRHHVVHWLNLPVTIDDRPIGRLLVLRDITDRHTLERQREELIDMVVHDLRNPATAISGTLLMLQSYLNHDDIPEGFDEMMQLAERNVNKMLELIQEILDISQLESGQLPLEKGPVFLHTLIPDTLLLQRPIAEMKSLQLKSEVTDTLPAAWADDRIIRRVLQNLVDNAAKFSRRQGTIIVSAKVLQEEGQTGQLQISVSDEGLGIPAELRNHIFDKFVSGQHKRRGSGLGLTFCRLAIQAHYGQIWVESEAGLGSTFHFTLPLASV